MNGYSHDSKNFYGLKNVKFTPILIFLSQITKLNSIYLGTFEQAKTETGETKSRKEAGCGFGRKQQ
jgi:hypothetical protein